MAKKWTNQNLPGALHFVTGNVNKRRPIFHDPAMARALLEECQKHRAERSCKLIAFVVMPDHFHLISDSEKKPAKVLQFVNGIVSRRVIDFLKQHGHGSSLKKLQHEEYRRGHKYSLWDHHPNVRLLTSENMLMERVHYTHQNPVRAGLVSRAEDYIHSSVRIWNGMPLEDEPLTVDVGKLRRRMGNRRLEA